MSTLAAASIQRKTVTCSYQGNKQRYHIQQAARPGVCPFHWAEAPPPQPPPQPPPHPPPPQPLLGVSTNLFIEGEVEYNTTRTPRLYHRRLSLPTRRQRCSLPNWRRDDDDDDDGRGYVCARRSQGKLLCFDRWSYLPWICGIERAFEGWFWLFGSLVRVRLWRTSDCGWVLY